MSVGIIGTGKSAEGGVFFAGGGVFTGLSLPAGGFKVTSVGGVEFNGITVDSGVTTATSPTAVSSVRVNGKMTSGDEVGYGSSVGSSYRPTFLADPQKAQYTLTNETQTVAGIGGYYSGSNWYNWYHQVYGSGNVNTSYDGTSQYMTHGVYNSGNGWLFYRKSNGTMYGVAGTVPSNWNWSAGASTTVNDIGTNNGTYVYTVQTSGYMQIWSTGGNNGTVMQGNGPAGNNSGLSIAGNGSFMLSSWEGNYLVKSTVSEPTDVSQWVAITNPLATIYGNVNYILWNQRTQRWVLRGGQYLAISTDANATAWTIATLPGGNAGNIVYAAGKIWQVGLTGMAHATTDGVIWVKYKAPAGKEGYTVTSVMSNLSVAGDYNTENVYLVIDGMLKTVSGSVYDYSAIYRTSVPTPSAVIESFPVVESPDA